MKRRDFIKALPLGVAAASIPFAIPGFSGEAFGKSPLLHALLNGTSTDDRILVLINMSGGNDGLNCVIPFQDPEYDIQRANIGFSSSADKAKLAGTSMRGNLALNPMMNYNWSQASRESKMMNMFNDGKLAVIQNVGYTNPNRSHFRATDIWNSASDEGIIVSTGWVGRYLENTRPNYPFDVQANEDPLALTVGYTTTLAFQGDKSIMGIAVNDPSNYTAASFYGDDTPPDTNFGHELGFVRNILTQSDVYGKRFDALFPSGQQQKNNVTYPAANPLAQQLKKVAWCISKGMKTKVYFVQQGGYDTHIQQNSKDYTAGQGKLLFELAEAISLFQADIEAFGIADKVIGMTYSEFGRRVNENGSAGTDHGTCAPQFVFGSQVNGNVYGNNPNLTNLDIYADLKNQFDFRQLYASVLSDWFGGSDALRKAVLNKPEFTKQSPDFSFQFPVNGSGAMQSLIKTPAGVGSSSVADRIFILQQNYPNPVVSETTIAFNLSETSRVTLEVFDSRGELVATPVASTLGRGQHPINFDARRLSAGTYFYRLDVNGTVETKSMKVIR